MSLLDDINDRIEDQSLVQHAIGTAFKDVLNAKSFLLDMFDFESDKNNSIFKVKNNIIYINSDELWNEFFSPAIMAVPGKEPILSFIQAFTGGENNIKNAPVGLKQPYDLALLKKNDYSWITKELDNVATKDILFPSVLNKIYYIGPMSYDGPTRYSNGIECIGDLRMLETPPCQIYTDFNLLSKQFPDLRSVRNLSVVGTFDLNPEYKHLKIKNIIIEQPLSRNSMSNENDYSVTRAVGLRFMNPNSGVYELVTLADILQRFENRHVGINWQAFDSNLYNFFGANPGVWDIKFACPGKMLSLRELYKNRF